MSYHTVCAFMSVICVCLCASVCVCMWVHDVLMYVSSENNVYRMWVSVVTTMCVIPVGQMLTVFQVSFQRFSSESIRSQPAVCLHERTQHICLSIELKGRHIIIVLNTLIFNKKKLSNIMYECHNF